MTECSVEKGDQFVFEGVPVTVTDVFYDSAPGWPRVSIQDTDTLGKKFSYGQWMDLSLLVDKGTRV